MVLHRFSFLDFTEYSSSDTGSMDSGVISGRSLELPLGSPVRRKYVILMLSHAIHTSCCHIHTPIIRRLDHSKSIIKIQVH